MMTAQVLAGYSLLQLCVLAVVFAAAVAIVLAILNGMGVAVPPVVMRVAVILALAFFGVLALYLLFGLIGRMG